ncbi:hypothetical protein N8500_04820 [Candidatus Puniceispirillum sp.]|nr:hypothetical protein [Candidatus Puniceispirillum sp.]
MYSNIIGTQQIMITAGFLGLMVVALIILRKKSTVIRASMKASKRVNVVEDTAVSPTERLRLITVDSKEFIMVSSKGHPSSLVFLTDAAIPIGSNTTSHFDEAIQQEGEARLVDTLQDNATTSSFEKSEIFVPATQTGKLPMDDQQQAFAEKFKRWRRQNDTR